MLQIVLFLFTVLIPTDSFSSGGQDSYNPELLIHQLIEIEQHQPQNTNLRKLNHQLAKLQRSYQEAIHSEATNFPSEAPSKMTPCGICTQTTSSSKLIQNCKHSICEACTLGYLTAHQGTAQSLKCWDPGCAANRSLSDLGRYLGSYKQALLYNATIRHLIRAANLGTAFCPHCNQGIILAQKDQSYGGTCSICQKTCCFICTRPTHGEIPCDQVEETLAVKKLFLRQIALFGYTSMFGFCPHCLMLIEHKDGCQAMVCGQNAQDKAAIPFKEASRLKNHPSTTHKTRANSAGCGLEFSWHDRIRVEKYLEEYDQQWYEEHQHEIEQAQSKKVSQHDEVMGQTLTLQQLETRLRERRSIQGADLRGLDLTGLDLRNQRFPYCLLDNNQVRLLIQEQGILESTDLRHTQLNLEGLCLDQISLAHTWLGRPQLIALYQAGRRNFRSVELSNTDLSELDLQNSDFTRARFYRANLTQTDLSRATLNGANFIRANLQQTIFYQASLNQADCTEANLYETNLIRAQLTNTDFTHAKIQDTKGVLIWRLSSFWP